METVVALAPNLSTSLVGTGSQMPARQSAQDIGGLSHGTTIS